MTAPTKWYRIRTNASARAAADAAAPASAEVLIYGDIGESWDESTIAAADFVREIAALDVAALTIRINSIGGSVPDGLAIYNAIKRHPAQTTVVIDGVAMSVASLIAMAGDTVEMADNAILMIHAPWTIALGNSKAMRESADMLDQYAAGMATSYASKTGRPVDEMLALLTDGEDHWYTAAQALEGKFVDAVTEAMPIAASLNTSRFRSLPAHLRSGAAAAGAAITPKEPAMPDVNTTPAASANQPAAPANPPVVDEAAVAARVLAEDQTRRNDIAQAFAPFAQVEGASALMTQCQNDTKCTRDVAGKKLLDLLGKNATPVAGHYVQHGDSEDDKLRAAAANAVLARAQLAKPEQGNPYHGYTLFEMARASLERSGVKTAGRDKMSLVAAAFTHSTSDFTNLLANVAEKSMLKGYEEAAETFQKWTSVGMLPDFKQAKRVDLATFPSLTQVSEGAEYKYATIGDRGETIQLATYGKLFSITRQAIINDDLNAFSKIPRNMGRAAIRTVGDLVYAVLTGNPTMSDSVALFHATHKNLLTGAAISTTSVDAMQTALATQSDGTATALNIAMRYLVVPFALRGTANVVANSEFEVGASTRNNTTPNSVRGTFEVIADARLDAASSAVWYGAADPALFDTIEVAYLDGIQTPTLEQKAGWSVDGVEFKVRIDAGVKALDFRTMAKNPGP